MTDTAMTYNPFDEGFTTNPYPQFAELRAHNPVHQVPIGVWGVFSYDHVRTLLRDQTLSVDESNAHETMLTEMMSESFEELPNISRSMLDLDPPSHTRLRRLVAKAFTPRMIEQLRPRVTEIVEASLDRAAREGGLELMNDLAFALPFTVITELLGMPPTDTVELRRLSGLLVRTLEPVPDPAVMGQIFEAAKTMRALVTAAIDWKRTAPANDLLTGLIAAEEDGDRLSTDELVSQVVLLYIAGHETTVNLIGNGVLALLHHPDQLELLRADPTVSAVAVDELLRYDSPVQLTRRITLTDVPIGGAVIEAGAFVVLGLASANRDETKWGPSADRIDLRRPDAADHVSFGGGYHHCLGAALARLEGEVAISRLVQRFTEIDAQAEPVWNGRINLRGLSSLPLRVA